MNWLYELMRVVLFLPPEASTLAPAIDHLHFFVIGTTIAGAIGITLVGGYFLIRYRRPRGEEPLRPTAGPRTPGWLEAMVIFGLFSLFILWWIIGVNQYVRLRVAPADAMPIYVTAKQWMWKFAYPEGAHAVSTLYVPSGRPVKLIMTARDVIHSFYVPDFRLKQDVLPGRYTTLWFQADQPGTHQILCTQYCGTGHSTMRGQVVVLSPSDYARWLRGAPGSPELAATSYPEPSVVDDFAQRAGTNLVTVGQRAAATHGCLRCHTTDGSPYVGPTWAGLYRSTVSLADGRQVVADEAYLTESMMDPAAKQVKGFPLVMPSYLGLLPPGETAAIVELIRSLREGGTSEPQPPPLSPGSP